MVSVCFRCKCYKDSDESKIRCEAETYTGEMRIRPEIAGGGLPIPCGDFIEDFSVSDETAKERRKAYERYWNAR